MKEYILKRILQAVPTIFGISLISFSLLFLFPGDPAEIIIASSSGYEPAKEIIEEYRREIGLDEPFLVQYLNWLKNILSGDLGTSWTTGEPVLDMILERFPASLQLFTATFIVSMIFSLIFGIISAMYKDKAIDNIVRIISLLGVSVPSFWLGLILIWIFSVKLNVLPAFGYGSLEHIILPVLTWSFSFMAIKTRFIRASLLKELSEDYITTAKAKGLSNITLITRHALRNALIPIVTYFSLSIGHLIVGSIMVEYVFSWPGLGSLLVESVIKRDFPVVQALILITGIVFVITNIIVDILYAVIDPRVRYGGRDG